MANHDDGREKESKRNLFKIENSPFKTRPATRFKTKLAARDQKGREPRPKPRVKSPHSYYCTALYYQCVTKVHHHHTSWSVHAFMLLFLSLSTAHSKLVSKQALLCDQHVTVPRYLPLALPTVPSNKFQTQLTHSLSLPLMHNIMTSLYPCNYIGIPCASVHIFQGPRIYISHMDSFSFDFLPSLFLKERGCARPQLFE